MYKFAFLFGLALVCSSYSFAGEYFHGDDAEVEFTTETSVMAEASSDSVPEQPDSEADGQE